MGGAGGDMGGARDRLGSWTTHLALTVDWLSNEARKLREREREIVATSGKLIYLYIYF